jgi:hypothetical protein
MVDIIITFGSWYWNSKAGLIITILIFLPIVVWEVVKRLPQRRYKSKKRRVKK